MRRMSVWPTASHTRRGLRYLCDHQHHRDGAAAGHTNKDISTEAHYEEPL
jgi:hypothetical protein